MNKIVYKRILSLSLVTLFLGAAINTSAAPKTPKANNKVVKELNLKKVTPADRKAAADKLQEMLLKVGLTALPAPTAYAIDPDTGYQVPDYFGSPNWAYSPTNIRKFVDKLAGLGSANVNNLGQYIPVAVADMTTYPAIAATGAKASDYYEIAVVEYMEKMHSNLPATKNRGYVQIDTAAIPGTGTLLFQADGTTPIYYYNADPNAPKVQVRTVDKPHYLGPAIVSDSDKPVRIKFYNFLPIGVKGELYIPTDTTVMGSGMGPTGEKYTQNRSNVHLHGNNTVWISDGSPHQWITPADEATAYPQGTSVRGVPDMADPNDGRDGTTTLYYTNSQSARLMFYHDHSFGITRLNVYAGEAAPYIIRDKVEKDLMAGTNLTGVNPNAFKLPTEEIPLIIQDRTFVDETTIAATDPTWAWGTNPAKPVTATNLTYIPAVPRTGDLWYPHVYSPAQNPYDVTGANPYGRWMYGPWFYPPTTNIENPPVANPYYDVNIPATDPTYRPPMMPGTPNPSAPGESFMDTPLVNGTVYPSLDVAPKPYRFRVLNAANDRFFNLSLYVADPTYTEGTPGYLTEVKMIPATPGTLPTHVTQIMPDPDPALKGPDWVQIGTEGGFLPTPVVIAPQPTTWNLVGTAFNFGNVDEHSLLLGTAERADVIVDFSKYAGKTLIVYNDAPAPFPANDTRYDYFTGNPDQQAIGGAPETLPGFGPNTRTIMQIKVSASGTPEPFNLTGLQEVFKKTAAKPSVFSASQETIIIPQAAYNEAYGVTNLPADAARAYVQLNEYSKTFIPIDQNGMLQPLKQVTLPLEPKAMHDEMSGVFDEYGRMSGMLGLTSPKANATGAPFIPYGYSSPPVDLFKGIEQDLDMVQIGSADDGTQIWQITHNGVDTHTIHTHLFSAQLINRVAWDGAMLPPDANELGWKETFRVNPLEQTVIAMRPKVPAATELPFAVPNSVRLLDPTMPLGAALPAPPPENWFDPQGNVLPAGVTNHEVNFGWEYVYHCHILSHEEMDMMHSLAVSVKPKAPSNLAHTMSGVTTKRTVNLNWTDNSANETGFRVQRASTATGPWATLATLLPNSTKYSNIIGSSTQAYFYKIVAINVVGDTETPGFPTITTEAASPAITVGTTQLTIPAAPTTLGVAIQAGPQVLLNWTDNATNETSFIVERKVGTGAFTLLATVASKLNTGAVSFLDTTVLPGNTYQYRVAAVNSAGRSTASNTVTAVLPRLPLVPSLLSATASVAGTRTAKVTLVWRDNSTDESGFTIDRSTSPSFTGRNFVSVPVTANTTTYTALNLTRNTTYYFRIRANNGAGSSVWVNANPFPVTTP